MLINTNEGAPRERWERVNERGRAVERERKREREREKKKERERQRERRLTHAAGCLAGPGLGERATVGRPAKHYPGWR